MVSFWPFKSSGDAAAFERALSTLTGKVSRATARNDNLRQKSRRVRVMWTLYAGFAYILAALLLTLVTGWRNWGAYETTAVAGGPILIYLSRYALTNYYDWRVTNTDAYIKSLMNEIDATIEKLKEATKYNSTHELLKKYDRSPGPKQAPSTPSQLKPPGPGQGPGQAPGPRTGVAPPATANIQRPSEQQRPSTSPAPGPPSPQPAPRTSQSLSPREASGPEADHDNFVPGRLTRQYSASAIATYTQTHWYDRILDALLGEDETQPKNRLALICSECRLVNGQAPPGTHSIEDVGRWRCGGCHIWNGKEKTQEGALADLVHGWEAERKAKEKELRDESSVGEVEVSEGSGVDVAEEVEDDSPPARSTRSKSKSREKQ
ncbi:hypothetical protein P280DRAFT_466202 [Massarina eburnea CBS 473.64]|uniref:Endoplasmic reticulum junction formation protein lunapark n=1 Tax=Massarina eburnea CBS 473.64 TaxID=1395130 RepID=A0A6A6SDK8_9PLEO|nr:hypothetical protein P280DRAFT_466202 [Massarina eburnea CBS 473.64]